MNVKLTTLSSL